MCMVDDAEYSAIHRSDWRRARKEHRCVDCGRTIQRGERYLSAGGLYEGAWWADKQCEHCNGAAQLLVRECGGFLFAGVQEDLAEHVSEPLPWRMQAARYVVGMRRQWKRFRGGDGLMRVPVVDMAKKYAKPERVGGTIADAWGAR